MTRDGTGDYRRLAVLAAYQPTTEDRFVLQLAHRRLGDSPTMAMEPNVRVDMAFYERRFEQGTQVRIGKVSMPVGIYNEVRYAGTLTPFYRAPFVIYRDGTYTGETVDGLIVSHTLRAGEPWALSADVYGGTFDQVEFGATFPPSSAPVYTGGVLRSKNVAGGQLWLATPLDGLRIGAAGRRQDDLGGIFERPERGADTKFWNTSIDANFERWLVRAERAGIKTFGFEMTAQYVQAGARVLPRLSVNGQMEVRDERLRFTPTSPWFDVKAGRDNAVGLNYHFRDASVLKLEAHSTSGFGYMYEMIVDISAPALKGAYYIASLSVAF